ncbi:MAG: glycoside hydrolase family 2 protein, partial [Croceivirga sp.]
MRLYVSTFLIFLVMTLLISSCADKPSVAKMEINKNWSFKATGDTLWSKAEVPGTVHTDLLNLKKIEDPFYRLNEHDLQWVDKKDWEYKSTFKATKEQMERPNIALQFNGIDTYGKIYLNDSLILETDNMFRNYEVDVKSILKEGANTLHVRLESPIQKGIEKYDALDYTIPVSDNDLAKIGKIEGEKQVSIFTRKAGYHFGWDWGPRLVTSGIWRSVILKTWNNLKIEDLFIQQKSIAADTAKLSAKIELELDAEPKKTTIELFVNDTLNKTVELKPNGVTNQLDIPFAIANPKRWWPNGMGNQTLYDIKVKISSNGYYDEASHKIGLRTIELVREPDSIGTSFYFKVNGYPVFMKGANYIPQDVFLTRPDSSNYKHIVSSAKGANMNMLRVWGGGIYENKEFYELCDEMGLLVWQDFMFACAMFPGDEDFLENVRQEAIDNVKRLRNHTSIALWCGNNEILSAWENWGWKNDAIKNQSQEVADIIWKAYDDIFHKVLPEVVSEYDNDREYWPSSPGSDFGEKESYEKGDAHYWMVWWGKQPFSEYKVAIPRFMSEYGFQSFPEFSSVKRYTNPEDYDIYSEVMQSHQRSSIGNVTIEEYMLRHYRKPKDFENFLYLSQLLQAYGIKVGIEAHRMNRDRCMGSLYWQINDCWPVASWSSIDYYRKWKALHYSAKKSFENLLVSFDMDGEDVRTYVISDLLENKDAKLKVSLMDFEGNLLENIEKDIKVSANQAQEHITLKKSTLLDRAKADKVFLYA